MLGIVRSQQGSAFTNIGRWYSRPHTHGRSQVICCRGRLINRYTRGSPLNRVNSSSPVRIVTRPDGRVAIRSRMAIIPLRNGDASTTSSASQTTSAPLAAQPCNRSPQTAESNQGRLTNSVGMRNWASGLSRGWRESWNRLCSQVVEFLNRLQMWQHRVISQLQQRNQDGLDEDVRSPEEVQEGPRYVTFRISPSEKTTFRWMQTL